MSLSDYIKNIIPTVEKKVNNALVESLPGEFTTALTSEKTKSQSNNPIDKLKSIVGNAGFASGARFKVKFFPPVKLSAGANAVTIDLVSTYCSTTSIPAITYLTYDYSSKGASIKIPYQKMFADFTTTHNNDDRGIIRNFFMEWQKLISDPLTNDLNYLEEYIGTIVVEQYDKTYIDNGSSKNGLVATYVLERVYPSSIGVLPFSYEANDALQVFDITWAYNNVQLTRKYED